MPKNYVELSEEQMYEVQFWLIALHEKLGTWQKVADLVDFSHGGTVRKIALEDKTTSKASYDRIKTAYESFRQEKPKVVEPKTVSPVVRNGGCLSQLNAIYDDIGDIAVRVEKLSDECLPLLRPGLVQFSQRLYEMRKILKID